MTLLIKNNLTILYPIELKGSGGTGIVEFVKIIKKSHNDTFNETFTASGPTMSVIQVNN